MKKTLCPFSKPIIGGWCKCQFANLDERCAGKMTCLEADQYRSGCYELVELFREKSRFVLGLSTDENELTHKQLMQIRCGGLLGMQRVLCNQQQQPDVLGMLQLAEEKYEHISAFPFSEIVRDIKTFSHRRKRKQD